MTQLRDLSVALSLLAVVACGDDGNTVTQPDARIDAPEPPDDVAIDAPDPFVVPAPVSLVLSATGADQLQSVTEGPGGSFYAAGFAASTLGGARMLQVVKLTATGQKDTTFSGDGVAALPYEFKGGSDEIDIATQSDGKIIVSFTHGAVISNPADAADTDVAVVRLEADGDVDATFAGTGIRTIDLNTSLADGGGMIRGRDGVRGLAIAPNNTIYLHATQRGSALRTDADFVVVKLTASGSVDTTWGTAGKFVLDIFANNANSADTPRGLRAFADGTVIAYGYSNSNASGNTVQPVLYKINPAGTALDTTFADQGLFHEVVLAVQTEIYSVAFHGNSIVTAGYGRASGSANDWVTMRFDVDDGDRDTTFGGAAMGAVMIDPSGTHLGSNCRNAIGLPSGSTILIGSTGPSNMPTQDAAFAVVKADGTLDTAYGTGVHKLPLGMNSNDQFWGGAVSGNNVLLVGWQGGGATPTEALNDDSYGLLFARE